jgi:hypothetical protein
MMAWREGVKKAEGSDASDVRYVFPHDAGLPVSVAAAPEPSP